MKLPILTILFLSLIVLNSCENKCTGIACFTPPPTFNFELVDSSGSIDSSKIKSVKLKNTSLINAAPNTSNGQQYYAAEIGWECLNEKKSYDLVVNGIEMGKFQVKYLSKEQDCCSYSEIETVQFGSETLKPNTFGYYQIKITLPN